MGHSIKQNLTLGADVIRKTQKLWIPASVGQIGATAGWAIGEDGGLVRCPASSTASTFTVPVLGMKIGETLQEIRAIGQVESGGNNATLVMSVRKSTLAAADFTDAELDTDNVGTLSADTAIDDTDLEVTGLGEVLAEGELLYALFTATTGVAVDIALAGIVATIDEK